MSIEVKRCRKCCNVYNTNQFYSIKKHERQCKDSYCKSCRNEHRVLMNRNARTRKGGFIRGWKSLTDGQKNIIITGYQLNTSVSKLADDSGVSAQRIYRWARLGQIV